MKNPSKLKYTPLIFDTLRKFGWEQDRWGHFKLNVDGKEFRVKIQDKSLRLERKVAVGDKNEWIRLSSAYFSKVDVGSDYIKIGNRKIVPKVKEG